MACVMSGDTVLAALSIMVTAGLLGGISLRNACVPYLAIAQICVGVLPIGVGALLGGEGYWILVPPIFFYFLAMSSVVRRRYRNLVALMTAEQNHAEIAARFDAALAHMPHGLCTVDAQGKVVIANRKAAELFGATVEMLRLNVSLPDFIGYVGLAKFGETLRAELVERCSEWLRQGNLPLDLVDGRQLELSRNPVPNGSSVVIIEDVTERAQGRSAHSALGASQFADRPAEPPLSRRSRRTADGRRRGPRESDGDVRRPRRLQAHQRHARLQCRRRTSATRGRPSRNTMRHGELAARLGGDEFAIVATYVADSAFDTFARKIIRDLSVPYELDSGAAVRVGVSVGIALARPGEAFESALKCADAALYDAKRDERGGYRLAAETGSATDHDEPAATALATPRR